MLVKSSPPQQDAMAEAWTADFLALGQAFYHWAILPSCNLLLKSEEETTACVNVTYNCTHTRRCAHIHICTYKHANIQMYLHKGIHVYTYGHVTIHSKLHVCKCTHIRVVHAYKSTYIQQCMHTEVHTFMCTHVTCIYIEIYIHANA